MRCAHGGRLTAFLLSGLLAKPGDHVILPDVISKEPLGPVVRQDDVQWFNIVVNGCSSPWSMPKNSVSHLKISDEALGSPSRMSDARSAPR